MPAVMRPVLPQDAIAALAARGHRLAQSYAWQDFYAQDHARAFTVAKSLGYDILADIHGALDVALAEGLTPRQFAAELVPLLQAKGWWGRSEMVNPRTGLAETVQLGSKRRLNLIFDVNMRVSYAAGQWASFERNKAARPFLRYVHMIHQPNPRLHHKALHNIVLPIDHPFWDTHFAPNGWNCKCTIQSLSRRDIDRLRSEGEILRFEPPTIQTVPWTNKATGEVRHIPEGIDPGWDYNPGKAGYLASLNRGFAQKVAAGPEGLMDAAVRERVMSDDFARFVIAPQGAMPVMVLPEPVAEAIGANQRVTILSEDTMLKQLREHGELTLEDYRALPSLGAMPTLVLQDGDRTTVLMREARTGLWRVAVVKATTSGQASYLVSYRFGGDREIERLIGRAGRILIDGR